MSASKDKILRKQQIEAGTDKRTIAAKKAADERRKSNIRYTVVAVILVLAFAFIFTYNSTWPSKHMTAVTIGDESYTVAETNYYYSASYLNFYSNYYYYISYGMFFDTSTSLADQEYTEGMTWRDYFIQDAEESMRQVQILYNAAQEAGYSVSEDELDSYYQTIESIETNWADNGYSSLEQYLNLNYGKGVTMDLIEEQLYRTFVASSYASYLSDSYEYTADELAAWYAENADDYDEITYAYYSIYADETEEPVDAQAIADAVAGMTDEEFSAYLEENYDGATASTNTAAGSSLNSAYAEWLLDGARQPGDVTVAADEDAGVTYVVMFVSRNANDYKLANFRHILIMAEDADEDGEYSEDEIAAAEARAQEIYDEWLAGDATEESFAALADEYTEDSGSAGSGGLYEDVYQGQMVTAIDEWLFDGTRQTGDTIVVTNDGSYTGAHVVYYIGESDMTYAESIADSSLRSEAYQEWLTAQEELNPITEKHISMCGKNH